MSQYDNSTTNDSQAPRDAGSYPPPQDANTNYQGAYNPTNGGAYSQPQQPYGQPFYGQQQPYGQPYGAPYYQSTYTADPMLQTPNGLMVLASPGARLGAFLIDGLITGVLTTILVVIGMVIGLSSMGSRSYNPYTGHYEYQNAAASGGIMILFMFLAVFANYGYRVWMTAAGGQTVGKKALGIKIITAQGVTPGFGVALLREVLGYIVNAFIYVGFAALLWDPRRQTWGDKIASTFVVKVR